MLTDNYQNNPPISTDIGGYFELELPPGEELHSTALKFNSCRNALRYLLRTKNIKRLFLPNYICNSLVEAVKCEGVSIKFYHINAQFEPLDDCYHNHGVYQLYVNYFGLHDEIVRKLAEQNPNLIVDNAQAFFSRPPQKIPAVYSPRKFFGVADGGYLLSDETADHQLPYDQSWMNYTHTLMRHDLDARKGFPFYRASEQSLASRPLRRMSVLTHRILQSIDYNRIRARRKNNFLFLHERLSEINELNINLQSESVPMVYPLLLKDKGLRHLLIKENIFVARYWAEVSHRVNCNTFEAKLSRYLLPLPIDQRLCTKQMNKIVSVVYKNLNSVQIKAKA